MKLAIISHTEHYKTADGTIVGWAPTVNEINHLLEVFDEIYHLAMLYDTAPPASTMAYCSDKISFIPIPSSGGTSISSKFNSILNAPKTIGVVSKTVKQVDCFQLRTPTGIGVYLIPYLNFFVKKQGWFKYAGNWNQEHAPLGYAMQRWFLKNQKRAVTINGQWKNQPKQCLTFENPCLTDADIAEGQSVILNKKRDTKLNFCYVGRLETPKGVGRIIEAFKALNTSEKAHVGRVHLVGGGKEKPFFEDLAKDSGIAFVFHGFLDRTQVFAIYKECHFFLMPTTASEGFPKVIAEAMNFGCIPIVSNISSIGQYIEHGKNGLIITEVTVEGLKSILIDILTKPETTSALKMVDLDVIHRFSYQYYNARIRKEILLKPQL